MFNDYLFQTSYGYLLKSGEISSRLKKNDIDDILHLNILVCSYTTHQYGESKSTKKCDTLNYKKQYSFCNLKVH